MPEDNEETLSQEYKADLQSSASSLWNADPDCDHDVVDGDSYSGVKCTKCPGWFCY